MTLVLFGLGAWSEATDHEWLGAFLFAFGSAFPLVWGLSRRSGAQKQLFGLPPVAIQPGILAVLALALAVCELAGIGLRRDVGRGVLALVGAGATAYAVLLIARGFRSRE
jgi:hypothetical protein